jgi:anthranilate phosphoribosyltransferase
VDFERARGTIAEYALSCRELGLEHCGLTEIRGGDAHENARLTRAVLAGKAGPYRETVLLNAAAALIAAGVTEGLRDGYERAREAIDSGAAAEVLRRYVALSNQLARAAGS